MNILQLLENIGSDTTKTHKASLIEQNKDNALFLRVVNLALNPYINFYIRQIPSYAASGQQTLEWALTELEKLSSRTVTGHAAADHLRNVLSSLSPDDATVITRVIGKDLRCGMADGLVNAVIPDFIPTYPCLLARPYEAKNIKNIVYPAISQLKADGVRVNVHINGDGVVICGRSGKTMDLLGLMDADWVELGKQFDTDVVIDGELLVVDQNGKILPRKIGNGIINKAIKGTISEDEAKMVRAQIWDVIPRAEFEARKSKKKYKERFDDLIVAVRATTPDSETQLAQVLSGNTRKYWLIPSKIVNSLDEAVEHFNEMLQAGEEGTILKNFAGLWEDSRSKHLVKMKAEKDADLEIIGWNPGEGKFEGMVGSLICASSDRKIEVAISGFSDALRAEITKNINLLMNTIVTVTYNERITSKEKNRAGVDSLFLPRFAEFRTDKTVANSSEEIK